jgi:DNA-binding NarL/FixJ family response regulator
MEQRFDVVIVEDSVETVRRLEAAVAEIPGLFVSGRSPSPPEALELVSRLNPYITILDMYLAGGTGIDVLKNLAARKSKTRVVVVTGAPSSALRKTCAALGARYFFDKHGEFAQIPVALKSLMAETVEVNCG